jgi:predicted DNA-binding protein (MmcQ/YjbR family)
MQRAHRAKAARSAGRRQHSRDLQPRRKGTLDIAVVAYSVRAARQEQVCSSAMKVDAGKATLALLAVLRRVCAALPGAEEYVMVHHPAFRVGKKPFAIAGMGEATSGATLSVNLGREAQPQLLDDARFARTPYIGQHGWVTITPAALKRGELELLVTESYRRVASTKQLTALRTGAASAAKRTTRRRSSS